MTTKNDFTRTDWNTLRDAPYLVGLATLQAGSSGVGTIKEVLALSKGMMESQGSDVPLIRDLTSQAEMKAAQGSLKQSIGTAANTDAPETLRRRALEQAQSAITLLVSKCTKEEIDAYRRLLYGIAEKVANAAREGGILGFGGTQLSAGEQSFLGELRHTLQLEQMTGA